MEDSIPRTRTGQLLSIADKLDTVRGCFRVGLIPSGSKDPFALRRAAQGIVKIKDIREGDKDKGTPVARDQMVKEIRRRLQPRSTFDA